MKNILIYICIAIFGGISSLYASGHSKITQLTQTDQEVIQIRVTEQIKLFQNYCRKIAGKEFSDSLKSEYILAATNLFSPTEKAIEISSLNRNIVTKEIHTYLSLLQNLPYTQVKINFGAIRFDRPFEYSLEKSEQTGEEWHENTIDVIQKFEGFITDSLVYRDIVVRQMKVFVKKTKQTWSIQLGNIQVKQIDATLAIKEAKTFYDSGVKYIDIYKKQKDLQSLGVGIDEEQMYSALLASFPNFQNAYLLHAKYIKSIRKELEESHSDYMHAGIYYFNQPNYIKAYEGFNQYAEIATLPIFFGNKISTSDENFISAQYYSGLVAAKLEIYEITIALLERIKDSEYMNSDLYQYLVYYGYEKIGDKVNQERILKEGFQKYPEDSYLVLGLIDLYNRTERNEKAIEYLQLAIEKDATNPIFFFTMGRLYEYAFNDLDNAESYFLQALKLNPDYIEAMSGLGRVYYNQAIALMSEANMLLDDYSYAREIEKGKEIMRKALPYFEEVHVRHPEDQETLMGLRGLYYNLNMPEEFDEIDRKLGR